MKAATWATLLFLVAQASAHARIGHTIEQCIERYGEPISVNEKSKSVTFRKAEFEIEVYFFEGKCEWVTLVKFVEGSTEALQAIDGVEIETFIKANGGDREWQEVESPPGGHISWRTKDDILSAVYISAPQRKLSVYFTAALRRRSFQSSQK